MTVKMCPSEVKYPFPNEVEINNYLIENGQVLNQPQFHFVDDRVLKAVSHIFSNQSKSRIEVNTELSEKLMQLSDQLNRTTNNYGEILITLLPLLMKCAKEHSARLKQLEAVSNF